MYVLSLIFSVIINQQVLKSLGKNAIFSVFLNNCQIVVEISRQALSYQLMLFWKFHKVSFMCGKAAGVSIRMNSCTQII